MQRCDAALRRQPLQQDLAKIHDATRCSTPRHSAGKRSASRDKAYLLFWANVSNDIVVERCGSLDLRFSIDLWTVLLHQQSTSVNSSRGRLWDLCMHMLISAAAAAER